MEVSMNHPADGGGDQEKKLGEFEQKQEQQLQDFEARQRLELEEFEAKEREELEEFERHEGRSFNIRIDRTEYVVHERKRTGLQLRHLAVPPIAADRDLFEVVPGGSDRKIENDTEVKMRDGLRFFTAPAQINPGRN
jgi:hypothetical protein